MARSAPNADVIVQDELREHITKLGKVMAGDVVAFIGPLAGGTEEVVRAAVEELHTESRRGRKLCVVLQTPGGYINVAERMVNVFRHHYTRVEFVIPDAAMSAGTVLVMSGDAIYMNYFSVLGPIDPQIERPDGRMVPALGYLAKYEELVEKSRAGKLTPVEAAYLMERFDPGELHQYEQARDLTIDLLKDWLVRYKFQTWTKTETRGAKVTRQMKVERADEIARLLNKTDFWHSHARGISMQVLRRKLKLRIEDFGDNEALDDAISRYFTLLNDYKAKRATEGVVHTRLRYIPMTFHKRQG